MKKLTKPKLIFSFVLLFVLLALICVYLTMFFFPAKCYTETCFLNNLKTCKETSFNYVQDSTEWEYRIKGTEGLTCKVAVKVAEVMVAISPNKILEGREMDCYIPRNVIIMPEEKMEYCHGSLKEAIQDQIIEKMHLFIVQKIGQIEAELGMSSNTTNQTS